MHAKSIPTLTPKQIERFWSRVEVHHPAGCWEWNGSFSPGGYGRISYQDQDKNHHYPAHRVAYRLLIGPIPNDLVLDHLCRNPRCVNPDHIDVVTFDENIRRGYGLSGKHTQRPRCIHGHDFTPENTYYYGNGYRQCKTCRRIRARAHREAGR